MTHERVRFLSAHLKRQGRLWPVVGVVGLRQSGKTTMLREQLDISNYVTLDDDDDLTAAKAAPKVFMARQTLPLIIDEIQKAPKLFDTIKLIVDKKRVPGQFYITGSSQFSERIGIRESLTGRIGLCQLFPLTLAEALKHPPLASLPKLSSTPRYSWESVLQHAPKGGMPIPMFLRDYNQVKDYWRGWLETSIYRDLAQCFKKSYQPEVSKLILRTMGRVMADGEMPTLAHFEIDSRRLRNYLEAMETIFMVRRISCHERGVGKDLWMFGDSGLAAYFIGNSKSDEAILSLIRHTLWNETSALMGYLGESDHRQYFKSARGTLVDWVWDNVPMKIVTSLNQRAFQERALRGAMNTLGSKVGYLIAPMDRVENPPKHGGVGVLPWSMWS